MATQIRTTLIPAIAKINPVNTFILDLFFGERRYFDTAKVQFDVAETSETTAGFRSFLKNANVVKKDGFNVITLDPLNINEMIPMTGVDAKNRGFGQPQFGGAADPAAAALETELTGFGKLRKRAKRLEVKAAYEALTTGKIVYGQDGIAEIDFNMPSENIETVATLWSDSSADPVGDMIATYDDMGEKPEAVVLGRSAYLAFVNHPKVLTANNADGKGMNFEKATADMVDSRGKGVLFVGRLVDRPIEVYCDMTTYKDESGSTQYYMPSDRAVYGSSGNGALLYGGIPVAQGDRVSNVAAEFVPSIITEENPVSVSQLYRSAPLPTLRYAAAFVSQKVV